MQAKDFSFNNLGRRTQLSLFYVCEVLFFVFKARKLDFFFFFLKGDQ